MAIIPERPKVYFKKDMRKELSEIFTQALREADVFQSCVTCARFTEETEVCNLYGQRPPARVIAFGCDSYFERPDEA